MSSAIEKSWTVMVYFAADNDLNKFAVNNLKQMMRVGSTEEVNLLAQIDRRNPNVPTKRYHFQKAGGGATLEDNVVTALLGETNTGDPQELLRFITWGQAKCPARHYLIVLWGHGTGTDDREECRSTAPIPKTFTVLAPEIQPANLLRLEDKAREAAAKAGVLRGPKVKTFTASEFDDNPVDFLNNHELQEALSGATKVLGRRIDVLGMDACLMSMAEVGFQLRDSVDFMLASEETEPSDSWPYHIILKKLIEDPAISPEQFSTLIVEEYVNFYVEGKDPKEIKNLRVTQSACDLRKFDKVRESISGLGRVLRENLSQPKFRKAMQRARRRTQAYYFKDYIDLFDFCQKLSEDVAEEFNNGEPFEGQEFVRGSCQRVMDALVRERFVVSTKASPNLQAGSHGLSIYFPAISACYASLDFPQHSQWGEFLFDYVSISLRSELVDAGGIENKPVENNAMPATKKTSAQPYDKRAKFNVGKAKEMKTDYNGNSRREFLEIKIQRGARFINSNGKVTVLTDDSSILVPSRTDLAIKLPASAFVARLGGAEIKVTEGTSTKVTEGTSTKVGEGADVEIQPNTAIELPEGTFLKIPEGTSTILDESKGVARLEFTEEETLTFPEGVNLVKTKAGGDPSNAPLPSTGVGTGPGALDDLPISESEVAQLKRLLADLLIENDKLKEKLRKRG